MCGAGFRTSTAAPGRPARGGAYACDAVCVASCWSPLVVVPALGSCYAGGAVVLHQVPAARAGAVAPAIRRRSTRSGREVPAALAAAARPGARRAARRRRRAATSTRCSSTSRPGAAARGAGCSCSRRAGGTYRRARCSSSSPAPCPPVPGEWARGVLPPPVSSSSQLRADAALQEWAGRCRGARGLVVCARGGSLHRSTASWWSSSPRPGSCSRGVVTPGTVRGARRASTRGRRRGARGRPCTP